MYAPDIMASSLGRWCEVVKDWRDALAKKCFLL